MEIQPDLSVCVAAPLGQEALSALLHSLYVTAEPLALEAVVVTGRLAADALQQSFPRVMWYETEREEPVMVAAHRALRLARGRYLALLASLPVVFQAGALPRLITFLDDRPEVGLASPHFQAMNSAAVPVAGRFPSLPRFLAAAVLGRVPAGLLSAPAFSREVDWLHSPCLLVRRELLEEIGPPPEAAGALWELAYGWRAREAGWRSFLLREALLLCDSAAAGFSAPGAFLKEGSRYFLRKWSGAI